MKILLENFIHIDLQMEFSFLNAKFFPIFFFFCSSYFFSRMQPKRLPDEMEKKIKLTRKLF